MKKSYIKSYYKLKVINDGSSFYRWEHPWKGWIALTIGGDKYKDISSHPIWKSKTSSTNQEGNQTSYIKDYAKKFNKK